MAIEYTIASIPTEYKGTRYRSRLEARWGAFFDLCGWEAEYEPIDLGSWSPDFLLRGRRAEILVEVKPVTSIDVPTIHKMHAAAEQAGFKGDLLLVGTAPYKWGLIPHRLQMLGWMCTNETPTQAQIDRSAERRGFPAEIQKTPWFAPAELIYDRCFDVTGIFTFDRSRSGNDVGWGLIFGDKWNSSKYDVTQQLCGGMWGKASAAVQWQPRT